VWAEGMEGYPGLQKLLG